MKILAKRAVATLIDGFIYGFVHFLTFYNLNLPEALVFVELVPFFFKDIVFRNASIGKMMMGISIYNIDWKKPKFWTLVLRSFAVSSIGFVKHMVEMKTYGNKMAVIDWERDKIGTFVIDNKKYMEIFERVKEKNGDFASNMTELYNQYLRGIYLNE